MTPRELDTPAWRAAIEVLGAPIAEAVLIILTATGWSAKWRRLYACCDVWSDDVGRYTAGHTDLDALALAIVEHEGAVDKHPDGTCPGAM